MLVRRYSYADIKAGRLEEHYLFFKIHAWVTSAPLAWAAYRCGVSANALTLFGIALTLPVAALNATGHYYWAIALFHVFFTIDCIDGVLARGTHTTSVAGAYLDDLGHYVFHSAYFISLGFGLAQGGMSSCAVLAVTTGLASTLLRAHGDLVKVRGPARPAGPAADVESPTLRSRITRWFVSTFHFPNILVVLTAIMWQPDLVRVYFAYCLVMASLYMVHLSVRHCSRLGRPDGLQQAARSARGSLDSPVFPPLDSPNAVDKSGQ